MKIGNLEINLFFFPLIFTIGLELLQLLHLTHGQFDYWDVLASLFFWLIGNYLLSSRNKRNILHPFRMDSLICIVSYLIVYLSYVWT